MFGVAAGVILVFFVVTTIVEHEQRILQMNINKELTMQTEDIRLRYGVQSMYGQVIIHVSAEWAEVVRSYSGEGLKSLRRGR